MKLKVSVNGTAYDVDVEVEEEPAPRLATFKFGNGHGAHGPHGAMANAPTPKSNASVPASEEKVLRAPISGTVIKVIVEPGATVEPGAVLIILEAMKMETEITAPVAGTVADIAVAPGATVAGGEVLIHWA